MSDTDATPPSLVGLYQQLAAERAGRARAALARETTVERLFAQSAVALEDAAGVLLHAAYTFIALDGPLPDCSPSRPVHCSRSRRGLRKPPTSRAPANRAENEGRNHHERTRDRELQRRRGRPSRARRPRDRRRRLARA